MENLAKLPPIEENQVRFVSSYFEGIKSVLDSLPKKEILGLFNLLLEVYHDEKTVFTMGNGGSASTASHFTCDINKGVSINLEKKFKVICLNDNLPTLLAYGNDFSYNEIFVEPLKNFLRPGDLVIGFSGSGNSPNILKAIEFANSKKAKTFGLVGFSGGKLRQLAQASIHVNIHDMQKSEDVHLIITHLMMQLLCNNLDPTAISCYQKKKPTVL